MLIYSILARREVFQGIPRHGTSVTDPVGPRKGVARQDGVRTGGKPNDLTGKKGRTREEGGRRGGDDELQTQADQVPSDLDWLV